MNDQPKEALEQTGSEQERFPNPTLAIVRGLIGMAVGGVLGVVGFNWIVRQGFYAIILPGMLAGAGCRVLAPRRLLILSIVCAVFSVILGLYAEWQAFPFTRDNSLMYFITHIHQLKPITLILIGLGGFFGFWIADRR